MLGIVDDEADRVRRVQIVVDQHQRPVPVRTFNNV